MPIHNILIVYHNRQPKLRATNAEALAAFGNHTRHRCFYFNTCEGQIPQWLLRLRFDIIVFHTLFMSEKWTASAFYAARDKVLPLKRATCVKICMAQDEFLHSDILCDFVIEFEVDHLLVLSPPEDWPNLYARLADTKIKIHQILAGYLEPLSIARVEALRAQVPDRTIDVGYRAWRARPWIGRHGQLKTAIAEASLKVGTEIGLSLDISTDEQDVFLGDDWYRFLLRCRSVIAVEGGASLADPDGSIRDRTEAYLAANPDADFDAVEAACFPGLDGKLHLQVITPRHLECCLCKTCLILVEGEYNGVLKPHLHFIPVKKDFSDLADALRSSRDPELRQRLTDNAYRDVVASGRYSYPAFLEQLMTIAAPGLQRASRGVLQTGFAIAARLALLLAERRKWNRILLEHRAPVQAAGGRIRRVFAQLRYIAQEVKVRVRFLTRHPMEGIFRIFLLVRHPAFLTRRVMRVLGSLAR